MFIVELVIVVAILAILVGILAPQYTKYVEKSRKAADASNLENLVTAFKVLLNADQIGEANGDVFNAFLIDKGLSIPRKSSECSRSICRMSTAF